MMPEQVMKIMLQSMLPMKFDTNIKLMSVGKEEMNIKIKGDIFISRLKGQKKDRIFIAIEIPEDEAEE